MVTRLDCNNGDSIGEESVEVSVNKANMLNFLGTIEEYTNEILNSYYLIQLNENAENVGTTELRSPCKPIDMQLQSVLGVGPKMPMAVDSMNVNPPKLLDYSSDENSVEECDNGSRPLTLDEVKSKMFTRISQQRRKAPKSDGQRNGRRGSILTRRRSSLLVAEAATSMLSRRSTVGITHSKRDG